MSEEIMDLSNTIQAKSDQLNAADLLGGPMTITITKVVSKAGNDQPTSIHYEGGEGKPYKPCLGMRRIIVARWGRCKPKGRKLTLFREPTVKWAGDDAGGIEISHMSDIDKEYREPVRLNGRAFKTVVIKPIIEAPKNDLDDETFEALSAEINEAKSMADLKKSADKIKAGNYTKEGSDKIRAVYSAAREKIRNPEKAAE